MGYPWDPGGSPRMPWLSPNERQCGLEGPPGVDNPATLAPPRSVIVFNSNLRWLHDIVNAPNATEFYTLKCLKVAAAAKSLQLCRTLCDPRDGSPPGSPVPGMLQERTLEWVAISFSSA